MKLSRIETVEDIQYGVMYGADNWDEFGSVSIKRKDDLYLFSYTHEAQYAGL